MPGLLVGRVVNQGACSQPSVVDQHVQAAEPVGCLGYHPVDGLPVGDVQLPSGGSSPCAFDFGYYLVDAVSVPVGDGHHCPLVGEKVGGGPTDP